MPSSMISRDSGGRKLRIGFSTPSYEIGACAKLSCRLVLFENAVHEDLMEFDRERYETEVGGFFEAYLKAEF